MIVVSDAGPIIHLGLIGRVDLLPALFGRILLPELVFKEVVQEGEQLPGSAELRSAEWADLAEHDPRAELFQSLRLELDAGESAALWLAVERKAEWILSDDRQARVAAEQLGFRVKGTLGVLSEAKRQGLISKLAPLVLQLKAGGVWLSKDLIERVLQQAGEPVPE